MKSRCCMTTLAVGLFCGISLFASAADPDQNRFIIQTTSQGKAEAGENLLNRRAFQLSGKTVFKDGGIVMDNTDGEKRKNRAIAVIDFPEPLQNRFWLEAESRCREVKGIRNRNYSVCAEIVYTDGTTAQARHASFKTGTHDWKKAGVLFIPSKPVKEIRFILLFSDHPGYTEFRNWSCRTLPDVKDPAVRESIQSADCAGTPVVTLPIVPKRPGSVKLIENSWSNPNIEFLENNLARMEAVSPSDGIVIRVCGELQNANGKKFWPYRQWWTANPIHYKMFEKDVARLKKLSFKR